MTDNEWPAKRWTIEHFSQANPIGPSQEDVPALLERVAKTLRELGRVKIQDIVFHSEITDDAKDYYSMTVYFHRPDHT